MDGLTEGRIVHYVMANGDHRPAIIVNVWKVSGSCEGYVNMVVFLDGLNDDSGPDGQKCTSWKTSICFSEGKEPNTWHWIEKA